MNIPAVEIPNTDWLNSLTTHHYLLDSHTRLIGSKTISISSARGEQSKMILSIMKRCPSLRSTTCRLVPVMIFPVINQILPRCWGFQLRKVWFKHLAVIHRIWGMISLRGRWKMIPSWEGLKQNDRLGLGSWCIYYGNAVPSLCIQGAVPQAGCVLRLRGRVVYSPSPVMPLTTRRDMKSSRG